MVTDGEAMVNQASLTGESLPAAKRPGSLVYAGTTIAEGACTIEVRQTSGQSRYDQIVAMIERSEQMKSATESKAANLADKLVPYTFAGSLLSLILTRNVTRALSVLMVDFSCALKLAMPLAVLSAMREAGREHITVKGGKFLETIARADTIVFDKTGTLTRACPKVVRIIPFSGHRKTEMLRLAACLEEHFPHSMANAVVEEAKRRDLKHEELHSKVNYLVAHGISSSVGQERVLIGSAHFIFEDEGCTVPAGEQEQFDALPLECSHLYLAIDGQLAAVSDGAAIAQEIADITIAAESLWELARLRQLAMALNSRIRNIYRFVLGFNGGLIALGVAGLLPPSASATLHNLSTLGISLHSMTSLPCNGIETTPEK